MSFFCSGFYFITVGKRCEEMLRVHPADCMPFACRLYAVKEEKITGFALMLLNPNTRIYTNFPGNAIIIKKNNLRESEQVIMKQGAVG